MNKLNHVYKWAKGFLFFNYINVRTYLRVFLGEKVYYVIGDSHTLCFQHEYFKINHIGPATAYKLGFKKSSTKSRDKVIKILDKLYKGKPADVIFVFGELDVRIHINKASNEKKLDTSEVINETVSSYMNFLEFVKSKYPLINIYIFNVLPQGEEENIYNYPFYANREKREKIALEMNKRLKKIAKIKKFNFISIYDHLVDGKGKRIKKFVFDDVHFNRRIMPFVVKVLDNLRKEQKQ